MTQICRYGLLFKGGQTKPWSMDNDGLLYPLTPKTAHFW